MSEQLGIRFTGVDAEGNATEVWAAVIDKTPHMGDVHTEGRRVVEVSVELFVELMAAVGMTPEQVTTREGGDSDDA